MPESKNVETVMKWIDAVNSVSPEQIGETLHPDYEYEFGHSSIKGKREDIEEWKLFFIGFPDVHYEVEQLIDGGEYIVSRIRMTGTQKGPFRLGESDGVEKEIPATNKSIDIPTCCVHRIKEGRIIRLWRYWDSAVLFRQLGLIN